MFYSLMLLQACFGASQRSKDASERIPVSRERVQRLQEDIDVLLDNLPEPDIENIAKRARNICSWIQDLETYAKLFWLVSRLNPTDRSKMEDLLRNREAIPKSSIFEQFSRDLFIFLRQSILNGPIAFPPYVLPMKSMKRLVV